MTGYNRVVLVGNLTREPALRAISGGGQVAEIGLATNERYRNRAGEITESTCFVDVVAWGKQAETCCKFLHKGAAILVEGRLQFEQWQNGEGQKRSKLKVRADRVRFMGGGRAQGGAGAPPADGVAGEEEVAPDAMPF